MCLSVRKSLIPPKVRRLSHAELKKFVEWTAVVLGYRQTDGRTEVLTIRYISTRTSITKVCRYLSKCFGVVKKYTKRNDFL